MHNDFSKETQFAEKMAIEAGKILKKMFSSHFKIFNKEGYQNLVTDADFASEKKIIELIQEKYPSHAIYAEEAGFSHSKSEYIWYIDPLDGTVNFAHSVPEFCVSIALYKKNKPFLGIIYQPMTDEFFLTEKGKGAFYNEKKIKVSECKDFKKSFLATGFPYDLPKRPKKIMDAFNHFCMEGIPVRRLGSAALDLAYTASGKFDGFWETGLGPWDCAAGALLVEEAQGKITSWNGSPFLLKTPCTILATNGYIHASMMDELKDVL